MALELKLQGKMDKALRLFQHALALAPKHPEVLNKYGEYLEHSHSDVILADMMYFQVFTIFFFFLFFIKSPVIDQPMLKKFLFFVSQALSVNPSHSEALANRMRTATIVEALDQERLNKLDVKRDALSSIHESNAALRRVKKEAYFQHIYHSVGIEGNTMSLAQTRSVLETRMAVNGKSIDEHNEILGLDAALKYINATLVNR